MKVEIIYISICILAFLSFSWTSDCKTGKARNAVTPTDTINLWQDMKIHRGASVKMYAFRPEHPVGISVIVCPGGSYFWLDKQNEGLEVGKWLQSRGITAFVLNYRTAGFTSFFWHNRRIARGIRYPDMITDGQRALQWVWEHSDDYGIDKDKIGMMGFSAGGHLVMSEACFSDTDFLEAVGVKRETDLRPAFVAPIYPVVTFNGPYTHERSCRGLLGDKYKKERLLRDSLSLEKHIPVGCPPVFLVNCVDDPVVDYHNSVLLDSALTSIGVAHRYIKYETGGHGFGMSDNLGSDESRNWKYEFLDWLNNLYKEISFDYGY